MPVSSASVKETYLNTVSTTASDGTKFKLMIIGDELPKFYVNSVLVNSSDLRKYSELIDKLTPVLWQRQKEAAEEQRKENLKVTSAILKELTEKYSKTNIESFLLSGKEFIVNKQVQSNELFVHFWNKFGKSTDTVFIMKKIKVTNNSNI